MSLWIAVTYIISTIIIALVSPFYGLVLVIGSILIRFQDRFEVLNSQPTYVYMCLACIVGFIIHKDKLSKKTFWPDKHWIRFVGWVTLGLILMAPFTLIAQLKFLFSSIILYYFATRCLDSIPKFQIMFAVVIAISVSLGYEATSSYLTDPNSPFAYMPNPDEKRMVGVGYYKNANEFGALMVMPISFVFCLFLLSKSWIMRCIYVSAAAFLLFATGLTYSRTCMAIVGIMAMVIAALWGKGNIMKKAIVLGVVGVTLVGALTVIPGPLQERFMSIANYDEDESFQGRTRAWEQGFHMVRSYPIWGVGMSQWANYHGRAPHNSFVMAMAETGLPGIFFYLAAIFYAFKINLRIIEIPEHDPRYNRRNRILAICLTANLVGFCVYAFFGNQAYTPFIFVYTGLCAAMANLVTVQHKEIHTPPPPAKKGKNKGNAGRRKKAAGKNLEVTQPVIESEAPEKPRFPQAPV